MRVLLQSLIARLHEAEDTLNDEKGMFDLGAHAGLGFVLRPFFLIHRLLVPVTSMGEIGGLRCVLAYDLALPLIGRVAPDACLLPVQEEK